MIAVMDSTPDQPAAEAPAKSPTEKAMASRNSASVAKKTAGRKMSLQPFFLAVLPPLIGIALLVLIWQIIALKNSGIPSPLATFN